MPSAIPRRLAAVLSHARRSALQILLCQRRRLFQVHAAVIDCRRTGGRARIFHKGAGYLHKEAGYCTKEIVPGGRGEHLMLEMRVGHVGNRARAAELSTK